MAEWDGLVLELARKAEAGSGKYNFTSQFLLSGWKGIADLGMTMRALPCAGTLPPGADSFDRWAA